MSEQQPLTKLLAVALVIALCLAVLNPTLIPFVIFGSVLAFAPWLGRFVRRRRPGDPSPRASRVGMRLRVALMGTGILGSVLVAVVALSLLAPRTPLNAPRTPLYAPRTPLYAAPRTPLYAPLPGEVVEVRLPTDYSINARQRGNSLLVDERLWLKWSDLQAAAGGSADAYPGETDTSVLYPNLVKDLKRSLKAERWKPRLTNQTIEFLRRGRSVGLRAGWLPAYTTNSIPLLQFEPITVKRNAYATLELTQSSNLLLIAERHMIGETSPPGSRRPSAGKERVRIPIPADDDHAEIKVASPLLRNGLTTHLGAISISSASGWVLALLLGVASEGGRGLIARLWSRIFRRRPPARASEQESEPGSDHTPAGSPRRG